MSQQKGGSQEKRFC